MIDVVRAPEEHVSGIINVCRVAYWNTYRTTHSKAYINRAIETFYHRERVCREVTETSRSWGGYFVALDHDQVVGAGGGGMPDCQMSELFVLYIYCPLKTKSRDRNTVVRCDHYPTEASRCEKAMGFCAKR